MPRITVAELSETVSKQGEALNTIEQAMTTVIQLLNAQVVEQGSTDEVVVHESAAKSGFQPVDKEPSAPKAAKPVPTITMELARQAEKSRGGKLRFWNGGGEAEHGSVYIGEADDLKAESLTLTICEADDLPHLTVVKAKNGRRKSSKGRQAFDGRFAFGTMKVGIFVNIPRDVAKDLPDEVGFTLSGF